MLYNRRMKLVRNIVSGITTLTQYLDVLANHSHTLHPDYCPRCGFNSLSFHGSYGRKPDRQGNSKTTMNEIPIMRYACLGCGKTCSTLPECLAPQRWYLWSLQQAVLVYLFKKNRYERPMQNSILADARLPAGMSG